MLKHLLCGAIVGLVFSTAKPALAQDGQAIENTAKSIPCTCRFRGLDIPVGQVMCLNLPSGEVTAVCDRVLNNTAWKTLQQGCEADQLSRLPATWDTGWLTSAGRT